jgi:hypothetical protein
VSSFVLPANMSRADVTERLFKFLGSLDLKQRWRVSVERYTKKRSLDQNALLWSLYAEVLKRDELAGWDKEDLHEWALGEYFGWSELRALDGRRRLKPLKRSSKLSTSEFNELIEWFVRRMAEFGIYLELPNEERIA